MTGTPSFVEEAISSLRGLVALLRGDRQSTRYFDLTLRGLYGSLIALLITLTLMAMIPNPAVEGAARHSMLRDLFVAAIPYGIQVFVTYVVFNSMRRRDGFVPFLVVDNWTNAAASVLMMFLVAVNGANEVTFLIIGVAGVFLTVNNARLIVGLNVRQIISVIGIRLLAGLVILVLLVPIIAGTPETAAALPQ